MTALPKLPAPLADLVVHINRNPQTPMIDLIEPYRQYGAQLRSIFAQEPWNPVLKDPFVNVVPLFTGAGPKVAVRARNLDQESEEEKSKYIMPLPDAKRRPHDSPAIVADFSTFQKNFNIFSESSLVELDWSNVVAAGSSVVNCLLPVPDEFNTTKRKLREYYHEKFCPASDVDLFLYDLTEEQAVEKIKAIERAVRDALLNEVTVVRTKHALTIVSQYPVRHIQIVLRIYKSVSEILTGFDVDAAGGAYDGTQIYVTPRALCSFITQINHVDLSRRSPSYENRLSKYSHRNFEVHWRELDRSRVDPTIFERSFRRTVGLARLLVLESLPTEKARDDYMDKRRSERGRPPLQRHFIFYSKDIKSRYEDEVADWLSEEDVSNYHTFTIPYGAKYHARKVEKLCYTKDLLLNAEWNQPEDAQVYLHRHPAFFGRVEDVIQDCCGTCPQPLTEQEIEVAKTNSKTYISGKISFLTDDPGRQQIGSFNPVTDQDWTDMAYVGNTERLCQSIVNSDVGDVDLCLRQESADANKRDHTGRTPLHLAVMVSSPDTVRCLLNHGARLTLRLADGRTALHLAASRGDIDIIKILMEKSEENAAAEEEKKTRLARDRHKGGNNHGAYMDIDSDGEEVELDDQTDTAAHTMITGSFVRVENNGDHGSDFEAESDENEPDFYDINVLSWDTPCSPLHLAIIEGHENAVQLLHELGADALLPFRIKGNAGVVLTLTLALSLPLEKAKLMILLLLKLGAVSSQADTLGFTAFHRYVASGQHKAIDVLLKHDTIGVKLSLNHLSFSNTYHTVGVSPLDTAIKRHDADLIQMLLEAGAKADMDFDTWLKSFKVSSSLSQELGSLECNRGLYLKTVEQPLIAAIQENQHTSAAMLLNFGANPNSATCETQKCLANESQWNYFRAELALDCVRRQINQLLAFSNQSAAGSPVELKEKDKFLQNFKPGTYQHWVVSKNILHENLMFDSALRGFQERFENQEPAEGVLIKKEAINKAIVGLRELENTLIDRGAQSFAEKYPDYQKKHQSSKIQQTSTTPQDKTYKYSFEFRVDKDMTEERRDRYIDLMEAAWSGDENVVKSLTLEPCGAKKSQPPLKIDICDSDENTPFSIAFYRGHHALARIIMEIVRAQWSPRTENKVRYRENFDDEVFSANDNDSDDSNTGLRIMREHVDNQATIDNIGEVSMVVESHRTPLDLLCKSYPNQYAHTENRPDTYIGRNLFRNAMEAGDINGLEFLLDLSRLASNEYAPKERDSSAPNFIFPVHDFIWAVQNGKSSILEMIIRITGAGLPLDDLVKHSGSEVTSKPLYYQGLSVHGRKRDDWAMAHHGHQTKTDALNSSPLLHAALAGSLDSVKFFLSQRPHDLYVAFGQSKWGRRDSRLQHLNDSPGGLTAALSKWLGSDNDLVIHCAILADVRDRSVELLRYLIQTCPAALEKRSSAGETPLMVACRLGRPEFAKVLIEGNASQAIRNPRGQNLLHVALANLPTASQLRPLLDMIDPGLRDEMFLQRQSSQENGTTPLHAWVTKACGPGRFSVGVSWSGSISTFQVPREHPKTFVDKDIVDMCELLLEYSNGRELNMLSAAGETCLHTAVFRDMPCLVKVLVDCMPSLLSRENAVGRTPAELAHNRYTSLAFDQVEDLHAKREISIMEKCPKEYLREEKVRAMSPAQIAASFRGLGLRDEYKADDLPSVAAALGASCDESPISLQTSRQMAWDICRTGMAQLSGKRQLVSLNEANDVARRVTEMNTQSQGGYNTREGNRSDLEGSVGGQEDNVCVEDFAAQEARAMEHNAWGRNTFKHSCSRCKME